MSIDQLRTHKAQTNKLSVSRDLPTARKLCWPAPAEQHLEERREKKITRVNRYHLLRRVCWLDNQHVLMRCMSRRLNADTQRAPKCGRALAFSETKLSVNLLPRPSLACVHLQASEKRVAPIQSTFFFSSDQTKKSQKQKKNNNNNKPVLKGSARKLLVHFPHDHFQPLHQPLTTNHVNRGCLPQNGNRD